MREQIIWLAGKRKRMRNSEECQCVRAHTTMPHRTELYAIDPVTAPRPLFFVFVVHTMSIMAGAMQFSRG